MQNLKGYHILFSQELKESTKVGRIYSVMKHDQMGFHIDKMQESLMLHLKKCSILYNMAILLCIQKDSAMRLQEFQIYKELWT